MDDLQILEYIKNAVMLYTNIDLYDIDPLLEEMGIELSEDEKEKFEEDFVEAMTDLADDYLDQVSYDALLIFKELLSDKLPHYPEDNPGQLHLFED